MNYVIFSVGNAARYHTLLDWVLGVCYSGAECSHVVCLFSITRNVLFNHNITGITDMFMCMAIQFKLRIKIFLY